jgi:hypothetical protein
MRSVLDWRDSIESSLGVVVVGRAMTVVAVARRMVVRVGKCIFGLFVLVGWDFRVGDEERGGGWFVVCSWCLVGVVIVVVVVWFVLLDDADEDENSESWESRVVRRVFIHFFEVSSRGLVPSDDDGVYSAYLSYVE